MAAPHPLDRPVWSALSMRQRMLSHGDHRALRMDQDYGPFAASVDDSPAALAALADLIPPASNVVLLQAGDAPVPPGARIERSALGLQMIAEELAAAPNDSRIERLGDSDAAEMLALAMLTEPGPFASRTHQLGDFYGIREGGRLVAMAGERMKPEGFTEVSGVCTHPDHRGRGYAGLLMRLVAARIVGRAETPFLHVYATNSGAIALYRSLGYEMRCEVTMTLLARA